MPDLKALTLRYYEAVDSGDVDSVLEVFSSDATYRRPGYDPMVGQEALRDFYSGDRVIESGKHTVIELLVEGEHTAVRGSFAGKLKDGSTVELEFADFFTFDPAGKVTHRQSFFYAPLV